MQHSKRHPSQLLTSCVAVAVSLSVVATSAATVRPPANKYTTAQDIKLGRQAASQARSQLPMLRDSQVNGYVASVGRRLVAALPARLRHSGFRYSFEVVNARDVNAFALPGGPIFVTRGILAHMSSEAELAAVLGHECGHVAARHSVEMLSKAQLAQIGLGVGMILSPQLRKFGDLAGAGMQLLFLKHRHL